MVLGIIAAAIVVSGIIALQIKSYRYYCRHREEEMRLNAETDTTPIQLPARGFSLLREWASSGSIDAHSSAQSDGAPLSRGSSVLRTLSQMGRWGPRRAAPMTDLENQITEYRGAATANLQDQTNASASTNCPAHAELSLYQSRSQQWGSQPSLHPARTATTTPAEGYHPVASRFSEDVTESLEPEFHRRGDIALGRYLPWEDAVAPAPPQQYESFRREV